MKSQDSLLYLAFRPLADFEKTNLSGTMRVKKTALKEKLYSRRPVNSRIVITVLYDRKGTVLRESLLLRKDERV